MEEIKQGYQKTKSGIIPSSWESKKLEDICDEIFLGLTSKVDYVNEGGVPFVRASDISSGKLDLSKCLRISQKQHDKLTAKRITKKGDVLVSKSGTLGTCLIVDSTEAFSTYESIITIQPKKGVFSNQFLYQILHDDYVQYRMLGQKVGNIVAHLNIQSFRKLFVPLPTLEEQEKVASILSMWDQVIEDTTNLIDVLKQRKKGLMQQLLTGKKRLTGFDGEWEESKLGEFFTERKDTGYIDLPLLSVGSKGVYPQDEDKKDTSNSDKSKYKRICKGDIGYNTMRMWQGRSALSSIEGIVSPAYTIVKPKENSNSVFFSYLFKLEEMIHKFYRNSQGMVSDTWMCKFKDFAIIKFNVPPSKKEQDAIAEILTNADLEINENIEKLELLQLQKKGLMQQLLTGQKRVSVN